MTWKKWKLLTRMKIGMVSFSLLLQKIVVTKTPKSEHSHREPNYPVSYSYSELVKSNKLCHSSKSYACSNCRNVLFSQNCLDGNDGAEIEMNHAYVFSRYTTALLCEDLNSFSATVI